MLASICSIRRWSLLGVKFLSRLLTALNLLPSIAMIASENSSHWGTGPRLHRLQRADHQLINGRVTSRLFSVSSRRRVASSMAVPFTSQLNPGRLFSHLMSGSSGPSHRCQKVIRD
jgi:hypothetical protein